MPTVKDLVKLLNLEMEEEFYIYDNQEDKICDYIYKITEDDLYWYDEVHYLWKSSVRNIFDFFAGRYTIIKKPWKPKMYETYYYISSCGIIVDYQWTDDIVDLTFYAAGNCFRTRGDAEVHKDILIKNLKSNYEEDVKCYTLMKKTGKI